jgi:hypothetical protein
MSTASAQVVLTVQEGKRLIAKGLVAWEPFRRARESGVIAIAKGTTNAYVVEELLGGAVDKTKYVTGRVLPSRNAPKVKLSADMPDLVLREGKQVEGRTAVEAAAEMGPDDIFLKGANAINYELGQAAVLIGHATGGTVGAALGTLVSRRVRIVVPVGLEKNVPLDLADAAAAVRALDTSPALWQIPGEVFTEIEAFEALAGVDALPVAAGGIGGAEGSTRFLLVGDEEPVAKAVAAVKEIQGEPAFIS